MAKTSVVFRVPLGAIAEVEGTCSKSAKQAEVPHAQKQPSDMSHINDTSLTCGNTVNTTSSTPLQRTPRDSVNIYFGTISNPKQKKTNCV